MEIAIDTSTETASLALTQDGAIISELTWRSGQNHTTQLLTNLSHLLSQVDLRAKDASGIIVARGPGSYNGLRVGISTAKGLAFSLDIPIVGISTISAEAYQYAGRGLPVCPIYNAGRGEVAAAIYQMQDGDWTRLVPEHITTVEVLCSQVSTETIYCGDFVSAVAEELKKYLDAKAIMPPPAARLRRAGFLAELGLKRLKAGEFDDPVTLQPLYLRGPAITVSKHHK